MLADDSPMSLVYIILYVMNLLVGDYYYTVYAGPTLEKFALDPLKTPKPTSAGELQVLMILFIHVRTFK